MNFLSPWHILLVALVALLLFGNRLPDVARSMGRAINEFKRGLRDVKDDIDAADEETDKPRGRLKRPADELDEASPRPREKMAATPRSETTPPDLGGDS